MNIMSTIPILNSSVTGIGFFDGIHIGHKALIDKVVELSKKSNMPSVIVTFKKSPAEQFLPDVKYITNTNEKRKIISELGVDYLIELPFNKKIINTSAYDFIKYSLIEKLNAKIIVTGFNFTFGKNKYGNADTLYSHQNEFNYEYIEIPPIKIDNLVMSSTYIKTLLNQGKIEIANNFIFSPFQLSGKVIMGSNIGAKIGYPTANIQYDMKKVQIPYGVYTVVVEYHNNKYQGIMNYGTKPTINKNSEPIVEVHILNFKKCIYNKNIKVQVIKKIRNEKKFNSIEELKSQIEKDIKKC